MFHGDGESHRAFGPIRVACRSSLDAELAAIGNGLAVAAKLGVLGRKVVVILQSDNVTALGLVLGSSPSYRHSPSPDATRDVMEVKPINCWDADHADILKYIAELQLEHKFVLMVRHVRGHQGRASGRHRMNEEVDGLAKRGASAA